MPQPDVVIRMIFSDGCACEAARRFVEPFLVGYAVSLFRRDKCHQRRESRAGGRLNADFPRKQGGGLRIPNCRTLGLFEQGLGPILQSLDPNRCR